MNKAEAIAVIEECLACEKRLGMENPSSDFDEWRMQNNQALEMALKALQDPLLAYLHEEVDYRLQEFFELKQELITPELVDRLARKLQECQDWAVFDFEAMDKLLKEEIGKWEFEREGGVCNV